MPTQKNVAQLQNLVAHYEQRVSTASNPEDMRSFCFSYWLGVAVLMQGRPCLPSVVGGFKRVLNNLLETEDLLGYVEACNAIRNELVQCGSWNRIPFMELKPRGVRGVRMAIEHAIEPSLIAHPSTSFDVTCTFLGWMKRLPVCIRSTRESVADYVQGDVELSSIDFEDNRYVKPLAEIWSEWFKSFELHDPFLPRHGPGSTADAGRIRSQKWECLSVDHAARVCLRLPSLKDGIDLPLGKPNRLAKVVFVPKQFGKDRTICMEPAALQFLQQGVSRQLSQFTHSDWHPMSLLVNIYSQDVNRRLCALAYTEGYATIDLSNASDSVSWRLIGELGRGLPLLRYLYGTRSTSTLLDGQEYHFDKFAPMGSALCFPIECMVFASIVELAYRIHYGKASRGHHSGCSVYGDDIICPSELYSLVVDILVTLGFTVNASKSFSTGAYFESCGVEYLYGVRIYSIRHPRKRLDFVETVSPDELDTVSSLANTLALAGCVDARRLLLTYYKSAMVVVNSRLVPFMDLMRFDDKHCLSMNPHFGAKHWDHNLQCSVTNERSVEIVTESSGSDFQQWKSDLVPRTREQRIAEKESRNVTPSELWSQKGVTMLSRLHYWKWLETGKFEVVGVRRTGRLHHKLQKKIRSLWQTNASSSPRTGV